MKPIEKLARSLELINELNDLLTENESSSFMSSYLSALKTEVERQLSIYNGYTQTQEIIDSGINYEEAIRGTQYYNEVVAKQSLPKDGWLP